MNEVPITTAQATIHTSRRNSTVICFDAFRSDVHRCISFRHWFIAAFCSDIGSSMHFVQTLVHRCILFRHWFIAAFRSDIGSSMHFVQTLVHRCILFRHWFIAAFRSDIGSSMHFVQTLVWHWLGLSTTHIGSIAI